MYVCACLVADSSKGGFCDQYSRRMECPYLTKLNDGDFAEFAPKPIYVPSNHTHFISHRIILNGLSIMS